ncbi:hypothetical protein B0H17DRAFT_1069806 [Mycena rosella]|uniref:F-box domain-containing protein n=1 Tax=Mycena rosella TaxID=1033263 RepID=A0AAD7GC56_MYCRO|nr:hypothetical protein B0H17DRAFT_1069806 [Mycena rosella]
MTTSAPSSSSISGLHAYGHADLVRELLRSHRQLPADQLSSVVSSLSDELLRYDEDITALEAQLARLVSERAVLRSLHTDCGSLLAPIRRLPSEILAEIFALNLPPSAILDELEDGYQEGAFDVLAHSPLLAISQVCARWHAIAMGTPAL